MVTYYKATRPDGTDFRTGTVDYAAALATGEPVRHPRAMLVRQRREGTAGHYLSVSVSPTDCTGMSWPCRLFAVEPVGTVWTPDAARLPSKRACHTLRVVEELPAHVALGSQGEHVAALVERARRLSAEDAHSLYAAWAARDAARAARDAARAARAAARAAAWDAAWDAARDAAWDARDAAWDAAWDARVAAWDAAWDARVAARGAAWDARAAAWDAAWDARAARDAAWDAAWAWDAARAARDAAWALVVRDLISREHYDTLTLPWRQVIGPPIHPDDPVLPDGVS